MDIDYCSDCKTNPEVVLDHSTGDTICAACGLILESRFMDEGCEWRTFSDDNNDKDPNRVGSSANPFLDQANLVTIISRHKGRDQDDFAIERLKTHQSKLLNPDKALVKGFESIATMAERLSLMATIKNRANEIFKKVEDQGSWKKKNLNALFAACLFIACRENNTSRTLKEISGVANGVSKKEINKAIVIIKNKLDVATGAMNASELVRRFCSNLGLKNYAIKAVEEAVQRSKELDIRRNPKSVLAAIVYMITQLSEDKKPLQDIAMATEVAEATIKKSHKDVYRHASKLIPEWYAKEVRSKQICNPGRPEIGACRLNQY